MSNLVAFPDLRRAREEASVWFARLDRGLSIEERTDIRHWLNVPCHHKALLEMARMWRGMDVMSVLAELFPLDQSSFEAPRRGFPVIAGASVAALCIVAICTIFLAGRSPLNLFGPPSMKAMAVDSTRYWTTVGETRTVKLGDGTWLTLNTNSAVSVLYSPRSRDVFLAWGEASFRVPPDESRPFKVHADKRVLQADDTSFNVRILSPDNVALTVTAGRVRILAEAQPEIRPRPPVNRYPQLETVVAAHESAIVQPDAESVRYLAPTEMDVQLAWQRGMLIFQGEPLEVALAEVDRYTNTEFVLADDAMRGIRVSGSFHAGDIDGFLSALRQDAHIVSRRDTRNRVVLTTASTL
ncbi:MAG: FecR domain-containing protein [Gammaproteobacteria bacterium]